MNRSGEGADTIVVANPAQQEAGERRPVDSDGCRPGGREVPYSEYPWSTVILRQSLQWAWVCAGAWILWPFDYMYAYGYVLYVLLTLLATITLACRNCVYLGYRCSSGIGKIAGSFCKPGQRAKHQAGVRRTSILWLPAWFAPLGAGVISLARSWSSMKLAMVLVFVAALVLWQELGQRLGCAHCLMSEGCPSSRHRTFEGYPQG